GQQLQRRTLGTGQAGDGQLLRERVALAGRRAGHRPVAGSPPPHAPRAGPAGRLGAPRARGPRRGSQRRAAPNAGAIISPRPPSGRGAGGEGMHVVTGAFGYTGRYITRRLLERGLRVKTLTGHPDRPNPFGDQVAV